MKVGVNQLRKEELTNDKLLEKYKHIRDNNNLSQWAGRAICVDLLRMRAAFPSWCKCGNYIEYSVASALRRRDSLVFPILREIGEMNDKRVTDV